MEFLHKPRKLLITGRSGTGKTQYFLTWIESVRGYYPNIFIFDHEGEFAARTRNEPIRTIEQLQRYSGGIQCFDCCELFEGELECGFNFYCDYVFQHAKRNSAKTLFCCDEMQKIIGTDLVSHELSCLIETGRRYRIDACIVSQQVNLIHNRIRNQSTEVVTFRQNDDRAIKWLVEFGFDGDEIRNLASGEYLCRADNGAERSGQIFR